MTTETQRQFFAISLLMGAIITLSFIPAFTPNTKPVGQAQKPDAGNEKPQLANPFESLELMANASYVYDVREQKVLYAHNAELQVPLASITKAMTALVAAEKIPLYNTITISADDLRAEGDTGLYMHEEWDVKDLLDYTLVTSSNDGASAIASVGSAFITKKPENRTTATSSTIHFIDAMNTVAKELGLTQTYFINESGLDVTDTLSGAYGSARDVGMLFSYILEHYPYILDATRYQNLTITSLSELSHELTNTNESVNQIPGLLGSKTGFTALAGGNLAVIFDAGIGHPIVVVALGSTYEDRFKDVEKLVWAALEYLAYEDQILERDNTL